DGGDLGQWEGSRGAGEGTDDLASQADPVALGEALAEQLAEAFERLGRELLGGGGGESIEGQQASGDAEEVEELGELAAGGTLVGEVIEDVGQRSGEGVAQLPLQLSVLEELPWHRTYLETGIVPARRTSSVGFGFSFPLPFPSFVSPAAEN